MHMEDNDYSDLVALVEERLRELGLGFLSDGTNYIVDDRDADEPRLLPPQERLIEILAAFERHLASQDRSTVALALRSINDALVDGQIEDARYSPLVGSLSIDSYSLMAVPELRGLREELSALRAALNPDTGPDVTPSPR